MIGNPCVIGCYVPQSHGPVDDETFNLSFLDTLFKMDIFKIKDGHMDDFHFS